MASSTTIFAILAFGKLGASAKLSLETILKLHNVRICVSGDLQGISWVRKNLGSIQLHKLCIHYIPNEELERLQLLTSDFLTYSNFGQERFIKLTTFKWYLISDIFKRHPQLKQLIFSDLDVYWLRNPIENIFALDEYSSCVAVIQDDTPLNKSKVHFCTGIMFWANTKDSIKILNRLYTAQMTTNVNGKFIPDEPIFNNWYEKLKDTSIIKALKPDQYVIGHRFFHLVLSFGFSLKNVIAFHSNYVVGEKNKKRRLFAIKYRLNRDARWIPFFLVELYKKTFH